MKDNAAKKINLFNQELLDSNEETLRILSDREIEEKKISKGQLWFMLLKDEPIGPFHQNDLARFLEENPHFPRDTKISNFNHPLWLPIYRYPQFQRRRSANEENEETFWILENGLKKGPYSATNVTEHIKDSSYLPTQLISDDKGLHWKKIIEHPLFQKIKNEIIPRKLPSIPQAELLSKEGPRREILYRPEAQVLMALGLIDRQRQNKAHPFAEDIDNETNHYVQILQNSGHSTPQIEEKVWWKILLKTIGTILFFIIGIISIYWNLRKTPETPSPTMMPTGPQEGSKQILNQQTFPSSSQQQMLPPQPSMQRMPGSFNAPPPPAPGNFPHNNLPMIQENNPERNVNDMPPAQMPEENFEPPPPPPEAASEENFPSPQSKSVPMQPTGEAYYQDEAQPAPPNTSEDGFSGSFDGGAQEAIGQQPMLPPPPPPPESAE